MMETLPPTIWQKIAETPWWIFALYFYTFLMGFISFKSKNINMSGLMALPIILILFASAASKIPMSSSITLTALSAGLIGSLLGRLLFKETKSYYHCPHCYPAPTRHTHHNGPISFFFMAVTEQMCAIFLSIKNIRLFINVIKKLQIRVLHRLKFIKLTSDIDRSQLTNSVLVLWDEAKRRGLPLFNVKQFKQHTVKFLLIHQNKKYYFKFNPIYLMASEFNGFYYQAIKLDDKYRLKKALLRHHLPCPLGRAFYSSEKALAYGLKLGFPLAVKPAVSSLSCHVFFDIHTKQTLQEAIAFAKQVHGRIIVERYIPGDVYRAVIVGHALAGCIKRQASHVVGDGVSTIEELIDKKNAHPWRGDTGQRDCTLYKIQKNKIIEAFLAAQDLSLSTVLEKGCIAPLAKKINVGQGADLINVTSLLHIENKELLEHAHRVLRLPLSGLDFICQDITKPWHKQSFAIIENNSLPHIDGHHYPSTGEPINVASKVWDFVLDALEHPEAVKFQL